MNLSLIGPQLFPQGALVVQQLETLLHKPNCVEAPAPSCHPTSGLNKPRSKEDP